MTDNGKIYFASDLHLGTPDYESSLVREKHFVKWLDKVGQDASEIFLVGDVFDFWFEYKRAVPKGFVRLFGKIAELADRGIQIHFFAGNHDLWLRDYFVKELGVQIYFKPQKRNFHGKIFYIHHGDGLGPGDHQYKFLKWIFTNRFFQWCFARLHPNFGIGIAQFFSRRSRISTSKAGESDYGENEFLWVHAMDELKKNPEIDYFVFGHRHVAKIKEIKDNKFYVNLGDWMHLFTYLEVGPDSVQLQEFGSPATERVDANAEHFDLSSPKTK